MKGHTGRKKKTFWKPIVIGFAAMYLVIMALVTWLVARRFSHEYDQSCVNLTSSLLKLAQDLEDSAQQEQWGEEEYKRQYLELSNLSFLVESDSAYVQFSAAFYDKEGQLLANSSDAALSTGGAGSFAHILDDFLSPGEKGKLAGYYWESLQESLQSNYATPEKYRYYIQCSPRGQEVWGIYVQQPTWEEGNGKPPYYTNPMDGAIHSLTLAPMTDYATGKETGEGKNYHETDSKIVWEWLNPDISEEQRKLGEIQNANLHFPYIVNSLESWQKWNRSGYLHGFPEEGRFEWESGFEYPELQTESDGFLHRGRFPVKIGFIDNPSAYLEVRMETLPWLAALNYMKYIYLAGFLLSLACMAAIIHMQNKLYGRQALLEETRRDFTNAIAHELKTPLGIIRNFAENLFEHNMEEKRDYYISQIIGQTEEMDHLVAEMIEISKLDSDEIPLKKETVSFSRLIHQQADRFEPMLREKNILIRYEEKADFLMEGDLEYLARAIWNLLSNAVDYNVPDGTILITIEQEMCAIENSGFPMDEEQLAHAFDLFYTGNKSRGGKEKHLGMGLFLTRKILELHNLSLVLENTEDGVRAAIRRTALPKKGIMVKK